MIHRMLVLILIACLLGGCSGGGATEEAVPPEESAAIDSTETPAADEVAAGSQADSVTATRLEDTESEDVSAAVEELDEDVSESESPPADDPDPAPAAPPDAPPSTSGLRALRAYVCKGIEQGEPTEAGKSFIPEDGVLRLCCFSEIAGAAGPETVYHVWRWGDREMARVPLEVKSSRWRTWSTKRILDEWRGEWHVDVTDSEGGVLTRLEFSVE